MKILYGDLGIYGDFTGSNRKSQPLCDKYTGWLDMAALKL